MSNNSCKNCRNLECGYDSPHENEVGCNSPKGEKWAENGYPKRFPFKETKCKHFDTK